MHLSKRSVIIAGDYILSKDSADSLNQWILLGTTKHSIFMYFWDFLISSLSTILETDGKEDPMVLLTLFWAFEVLKYLNDRQVVDV